MVYHQRKKIKLFEHLNLEILNFSEMYDDMHSENKGAGINYLESSEISKIN